MAGKGNALRLLACRLGLTGRQQSVQDVNLSDFNIYNLLDMHLSCDLHNNDKYII